VADPKISLEEVQHVARLARLELSEADQARMRGELDAILAYVGELQAVDVTGVEPTTHVLPMANVMREDEVRPSYPVEAMLANAPEAEGDLIRVPKILEE
jgi:aspartyl-tRNA(Asn)/glutamyl-tRNA(Gln) amidotransferase subunit C